MTIKQPIFITGIERSGSTIIARLLKEAGVWSGDCTPMMENRRIKQLVDFLYVGIGKDQKGQFPIPKQSELNDIQEENWRKEVFHLITKYGYPDSATWMYKSNRLYQTWSLWNRAFPDAKWIVVRRRTGDILQSCKKTSYMNTFSNPHLLHALKLETEEQGWLWWVHQQEKQLSALQEKGVNMKIVWPDRMVDGDYCQVKDVFDWLGLEWSDQFVEVVEPLLWKSKQLKLKSNEK